MSWDLLRKAPRSFNISKGSHADERSACVDFVVCLRLRHGIHGMGTVRYRAGQSGRAMFDFFMAASMIIFGLGYLGVR
jgi:hypothetical protein